MRLWITLDQTWITPRKASERTTNVPPIHSGPTRSLHRFNRHKCTPIIAIVVYVASKRVREYDPTVRRAPITRQGQAHSNTNVRPVRPEPTKSFHRCNQDKCTPMIAILVYRGIEFGWYHYDFTLDPISIAWPKSSTQEYKRTNCSSRANENVPSM